MNFSVGKGCLFPHYRKQGGIRQLLYLALLLTVHTQLVRLLLDLCCLSESMLSCMLMKMTEQRADLVTWVQRT